MEFKSMLRIGFLLLLGMLMAGCSNPDEPEQTLEPVGFHPSDECHVCGMIITDFPGPKGEVVSGSGVRKFCSTAEMLGWWLQPENNKPGARLFVHDMRHSPWDAPDDGHLIDARTAYYVVGPRLPGAMGAAIASLSDEQSARDLATEHGGKVMRFDEIDQQVLSEAAAKHYDALHGQH